MFWSVVMILFCPVTVGPRAQMLSPDASDGLRDTTSCRTVTDDPDGEPEDPTCLVHTKTLLPRLPRIDPHSLAPQNLTSLRQLGASEDTLRYFRTAPIMQAAMWYGNRRYYREGIAWQLGRLARIRFHSHRDVHLRHISYGLALVV